MSQAELRPVMKLRARRGPRGRLFLEGERAGRRFVVLEVGDNAWAPIERVGHPAPEPEQTGARSDARPSAPSRSQNLHPEDHTSQPNYGDGCQR